MGYGNGTDRARTDELLRVKQALFQLSYDPGRSSNAMKSLSLTSCLVLQSMAPKRTSTFGLLIDVLVIYRRWFAGTSNVDLGDCRMLRQVGCGCSVRACFSKFL